MRARSIGPLVLLVAVACDGPPPPPPPSPANPPAAPGLRPLTSRDGAESTPVVPETPALPPGHPPIGGAGDASAEKHGRPVAGTIAIAPALAARLATTDVLYLIARNHRTKAVVAVRRDEGIAFPHAFEIGPGDVMVQGQPFQGPFDLVARVSRSGDALAAAGDLEGLAADVAEGARGVSLVIDRVRQ